MSRRTADTILAVSRPIFADFARIRQTDSDFARKSAWAGQTVGAEFRVCVINVFPRRTHLTRAPTSLAVMAFWVLIGFGLFYYFFMGGVDKGNFIVGEGVGCKFESGGIKKSRLALVRMKIIFLTWLGSKSSFYFLSEIFYFSDNRI